MPLPGTCEKGFYSDVQKYGILEALWELWELHIFGIFRARKFGKSGAPTENLGALVWEKWKHSFYHTYIETAIN